MPPIVLPGMDPELVPAALERIEALARGRFRRLTASLTRENEVLRAACTERGWMQKEEQIEMKRLRGEVGLPGVPTASREGTPSGAPCIGRAGTSDGVRIEPLAAADADAIASAALILREGLDWGQNAQARLRSNAHTNIVQVARDAQGICGVIVADPMADTAFSRIEDLAVAPRARARGVGRALLEAAIAALPGPVEREVFLGVDPQAKIAVRLYRRLGFIETLHTLVLTKTLVEGA